MNRRLAAVAVLRLSRRCADPGVVDEVVQDTFVAVWRGARRWDGRGEVAAWIWGIGIRRLLDALRHRPAATTLLGESSEHEVRLVESAVGLGLLVVTIAVLLDHAPPDANPL